MAELIVELYGIPIGRLVRRERQTFDFVTDSTAFEHFSLGSTVLSESVPLNVVQNPSHAARRRNFFAELLPEGQILRDLADIIRVDTSDVIPLLAHYGRDVAGALQIYDPSAPGEPRTPHVTRLSVKEIHTLLTTTKKRPLGNDPVSGKTSLAGVQDKIVLALINNQWHQVHNGYPSTHIVKPESSQLPTIIFDEEYGARIARALQLTSYATFLEDFDGLFGLVIERFDRTRDIPPLRIHQEDMNQALGARGNQKYQENGGKVSLKSVAGVFTKNEDNESLVALLKLTTVSVAIGNVDLHAKNISILHLAHGDSKITPVYDVVPLIHQSASEKRMALAINGKYPHALISAGDLVEEAKAWGSWGMKDPLTIVKETLEAIRDFVEVEHPHPRAYEHLNLEISQFVRNLLKGEPAGHA